MPRALLSAFLVLTLRPSGAEACTCPPPAPACAAYWSAAAIFRGRVDAVERARLGSSDPLASSTITFTVLESFKGAPSAGPFQVKTPGSGAACGYRFVVGREYVVYATRGSDGLLTTSTCSRTAPLDRAESDVAYARSIAEGADPIGRISGRVVFRYRDLARGRDREQPAHAVPVLLRKPDVAVEARTDRAGAFSLAGLEGGAYDVDLNFPPDMLVSFKPNRIDLADARGCADVRITVTLDGRVVGRVLDASRRPIAGLTMDLAPIAALKPLSPNSAERLRTITARDGRYEFINVPPGTFTVGINTHQESDGIVRVLHPGVVDVRDAAPVVVRPGASVQAGDLVLPVDVEVVQVVGFVYDSHGSAVEGARVFLRGPHDRGFVIGEPVVTDFMGRFTIAAAPDGTYQLFAERPRPGDPRGRVDASDPLSFIASPTAPPLTVRLRRQ